MTNIISGDDFHTALKAGTLNPRAQEIADAITGAQDNMDRIGGLYEFAYRGALAGLAESDH